MCALNEAEALSRLYRMSVRSSNYLEGASGRRKSAAPSQVIWCFGIRLRTHQLSDRKLKPGANRYHSDLNRTVGLYSHASACDLDCDVMYGSGARIPVSGVRARVTRRAVPPRHGDDGPNLTHVGKMARRTKPISAEAHALAHGKR
jgi:hypothetical protein